MQSTRKKRTKYSHRAKGAVLGMLVLGIVISVIWMNTENETQTQVQEGDVLQVYDITETDSRTEAEQETFIDLSNATTQTVIAEGGDYILSGKTKYAIHVDAQDEIVHLILSGVDIRSISGPAIQISSAGKVVITLAENTENTIRDSENYNEYEESDAVIYSEVDVTINGDGELFITGYYKDGIHTKDLLKIIDGMIYVQAKRDGIRGNDGIVLTPDEMTIESEGNGIRTTNAEKTGKGRIEILEGNYTITAGKYAIVSKSDLYVRNCEIACESTVADLDVAGSMDIEKGCIQSIEEE